MEEKMTIFEEKNKFELKKEELQFKVKELKEKYLTAKKELNKVVKLETQIKEILGE